MKILQKIGMILILILLFTTVTAQTSSRVPATRLASHIITMNIEEDGTAKIQEEYFFNFFEGEPQQLVKDFQENTPSLDFWRADYPYIHNYFGTPTSVSEVSFELGETSNGQPSLRLNYRTSEKIFTSNSSSTRTELWNLNDSSFAQFIQFGTINVPDNTIIHIVLPSDSEVIQSSVPNQVSVSGNFLTVTNFRASKLPIQYLQIKPIAPPLDFNRALSDFFESPFSYVIFTFFVIVLAFMFIKREEIAMKIEEFIVENSLISTKKETETHDEDIDA